MGPWAIKVQPARRAKYVEIQLICSTRFQSLHKDLETDSSSKFHWRLFAHGFRSGGWIPHQNTWIWIVEFLSLWAIDLWILVHCELFPKFPLVSRWNAVVQGQICHWIIVWFKSPFWIVNLLQNLHVCYDGVFLDTPCLGVWQCMYIFLLLLLILLLLLSLLLLLLIFLFPKQCGHTEGFLRWGLRPRVQSRCSDTRPAFSL